MPLDVSLCAMGDRIFVVIAPADRGELSCGPAELAQRSNGAVRHQPESDKLEGTQHQHACDLRHLAQADRERALVLQKYAHVGIADAISTGQRPFQIGARGRHPGMHHSLIAPGEAAPLTAQTLEEVTILATRERKGRIEAWLCEPF